MWFAVLFFLLVFGAIGAALIGLGVGIGYLLRALIPGLEIDLAIVAGAVLWAMRETKREADEEEIFAHEPLVALPRSWLRPEPFGRKSKKRK
jgi:hypothetical protein